MLGRLEQHLLQPHALGRLKVGALGDRHTGGPQAFGKLVAHLLELSQPQEPRFGVAFNRALEPTHPICGDKCIGQLMLDPRDLCPQGPARSPLVDLDDGWKSLR